MSTAAPHDFVIHKGSAMTYATIAAAVAIAYAALVAWIRAEMRGAPVIEDEVPGFIQDIDS
jgi:hypothetical protein